MQLKDIRFTEINISFKKKIIHSRRNDTNIVNLQIVCNNNYTTFSTFMNNHVCFLYSCLPEEICVFSLIFFFTYKANKK